jgi:hypothetical protein
MANKAWINHVKKFAKQHKIKFGEALSKAGATFKKKVVDPGASLLPDFSKFNKKRKTRRGKTKKSRTRRRR